VASRDVSNNLQTKGILGRLDFQPGMLMRDTPSGRGRIRIARAKPPAAARVHSRSAPRTHEHRRAVIITCGVLLAAAATAATVLATESPASWNLSRLPWTAATPAPRDVRNAKVTFASEGVECSQHNFDNRTGRLSQTPQPCEAVTYDNDGFPIDPGAVRRFNELKKSFSTH
jgi:hypothetical protein